MPALHTLIPDLPLCEVNDMTVNNLARGTIRGLNAAGGFLTKPRKPRWLYLTAFLLPVLITISSLSNCNIV